MKDGDQKSYDKALKDVIEPYDRPPTEVVLVDGENVNHFDMTDVTPKQIGDKAVIEKL